MSEQPRQERRRTMRVELTTFCPTSFTHQGQQHRAFMQNLSAKGAKFRLEHAGEQIALEPGEEIVFEVRTPYGLSYCKGKIIWARLLDEHWSCGVAFSKLSQDPKDPLRCLMDSPF